jgi:hypothetical protein
MELSRLGGLIPVVAVAAALSLSGPVEAKSGTKVGSLNCTISGGVGLILGSSKSLTCRYKPAGGGKTEHYVGTINKVGVDIGITGKSYVTWVVFAPGKINRGALAGHYAGGSAEATVGVGLGANVLVGGSKKSIALQPVSVQGQTGLNLAAGIAGLTLKYSG